MDRGAEATATLSTYKTWAQLKSFAKELSLPTSQAPLAIKPLAAEEAHTQYGRHRSLVVQRWKRWATLLSQQGFWLRGVQS